MKVTGYYDTLLTSSIPGAGKGSVLNINQHLSFCQSPEVIGKLQHMLASSQTKRHIFIHTEDFSILLKVVHVDELRDDLIIRSYTFQIPQHISKQEKDETQT